MCSVTVEAERVSINVSHLELKAIHLKKIYGNFSMPVPNIELYLLSAPGVGSQPGNIVKVRFAKLVVSL